VNCRQPGCTGAIDADGFCDVCGLAAERETTATTPAPRVTTAMTGATGTSRRRGTTRATSRRSRLGAGLVEIPPVVEQDPEAEILVDPQIPEEKRYCANPPCGAPVGRSRDGVPGRTEGFCARCGHPFSFRPSLQKGDVVGGQYEVAGCIAHGGLGWIYLARDKQLSDRWVVLKGLLNTNDPDAIAAALAERRFLAEVDDHRIVRIYNFVEHESHGYIVMEYVPGTSLRKLLEARRADNDGLDDPLPVAHAVAYMVEILPAFAYLHGRGLLFCDFKPDNVMQTGASAKLIDLGGVYRMDDVSSAIYGTKGFQAPEIAETGPTVASDLYTVGRTLAVLCTAFHGYQQRYEYSLPTPDAEPLYGRYDALYRFLLRATAPDPDDRFQTAEEMHDQLFGVLREIVAAETGTVTQATSSLFTGELSGDVAAPDWRALPALLVDTNDPAAGWLASLPTTAPEDALALLDAAPEATVEVRLRAARELLASGRPDDARTTADAITRDDPWEWRAAWYRALANLALGIGERAASEFEGVYRVVPGELAPKLAMAVALERAGQAAGAARWYDVVGRTDPSYTGAAFGLARCAMTADDRKTALDALERVPPASHAHAAAQAARAEILLGDGTDVDATDVLAAGRIVQQLPHGDPAERRLRVLTLERALALTLGDDDIAGSVFGHGLTEPEIRGALEAAYRNAARHAPDADTRIAFVDQANAVRPRSVL
jgi:serine/threonine-protein kinase PknG